MQVEIGRARDLNRRSASAETGPDPERAGRSGVYYSGEKHNQPLLYQLSVRAPLPRHVFPYNFILFYTFKFMHLADAFIQSDLQLHSGYKFFVSMCVPWESNPQPFALLTQCSTTEPNRNTQEHEYSFIYIHSQYACANIKLWEKISSTSSTSTSFSGGQNRGAGFRSQIAGAGLDGKGRR